MSLLASEAIVDSRGYDVLSAEEVEELKKVRTASSVVWWRAVEPCFIYLMYSGGRWRVGVPGALIKAGRTVEEVHS